VKVSLAGVDEAYR